MAGHNKWSKVKHQKAVTDARKSKIFSKYAKEITQAAKNTGGNRESPELKNVIERAKKESMPKDNIERAIQKGASGEAADMEHVRFETYGPSGVAVIIEGLTDNNNRTSSEVKQVLSKHSCDLAQPGAASWAFEKQEGEWVPQTTMELSDENIEKLEKLTEALEELEDIQAVYTNAT